MIDATNGVRSGSSVPTGIRGAQTNTRQTTSDAFHGLFAKTVASNSAPKKTSAVSQRNQARLRAVQPETQALAQKAAAGRRGAIGILAIDMGKPAVVPTFTRSKNLVQIEMNKPVEPSRVRDATPAAATVEPVNDEDPIASLEQAMKDAGIDTSRLTVTPRELVGLYPGASWIDHEIEVSTQDGRSVMLATDLLKGHYDIGACDVQHMLRWKG